MYFIQTGTETPYCEFQEALKAHQEATEHMRAAELVFEQKAKHIDSGTLSNLIEGVSTKSYAEKLAALKTIRTFVVTCESARLGYIVNWRSSKSSAEALRIAMKKLTEVLGPVHSHSDLARKRARNNIVMARLALQEEASKDLLQRAFNDTFHQEALALMQESFLCLAENLKRCSRPQTNVSFPWSLKSVYSYAPAVPDFTPNLPDLPTQLEPVRPDVVGAIAPLQLRLWESLKALDKAVADAENFMTTVLMSQKSRINEWPFRNSLVRKVLCVGEKEMKSAWQETVDMSNWQKHKRLDYFSACTCQEALVEEAEILRCLAVRALHDAVEETEAIRISRNAGSFPNQVDREFSYQVALNNCLAADHKLRVHSEKLDKLLQGTKNDLTKGLSEEVTQKEYSDAVKLLS